MKHIFYTGLLCAIALNVNAQITLNQSNAMDAGDRYINGNMYSALAPTIVQGSAGASQTWNFTTTSFDVADTTNVIAIGWVPPQFSAAYPQSTLALYSGSSMDAFTMLHSDASGVYMDGYSYEDPQFGILNQQYTDPLQYMRWPLTYGTTYYDTTYYDFTFPTTGPSDSTRQIVDMYFTSETDAWGTLITSYGTYNVLRVKRTYSYAILVATHDSISGWSGFTPYNFDGRVYEWWTDSPGIGMPVASISVDYNTDTVTSYSILTNYSVGTPDYAGQHSEITLFPNPATEYITLNAAANTQWAIVDLTGKTVKSGVMNANTAEINVEDLSAGIYLLQMTDESGVKRNKKFVVE